MCRALSSECLWDHVCADLTSCAMAVFVFLEKDRTSSNLVHTRYVIKIAASYFKLSQRYPQKGLF